MLAEKDMGYAFWNKINNAELIHEDKLNRC